MTDTIYITTHDGVGSIVPPGWIRIEVYPNFGMAPFEGHPVDAGDVDVID